MNSTDKYYKVSYLDKDGKARLGNIWADDWVTARINFCIMHNISQRDIMYVALNEGENDD